MSVVTQVLGTLHVTVQSARNLTVIHKDGKTCDPLVRVSLLNARDGANSPTAQHFFTKVVKKSVNPVWEQKLSFQVFGAQGDYIEVEVLDSASTTGSFLMGQQRKKSIGKIKPLSVDSFINKPNAKLEKWFEVHTRAESSAKKTNDDSSDDEDAKEKVTVMKSGEILLSFRYELDEKAQLLQQSQRQEILQMRPGQYGYKNFIGYATSIQKELQRCSDMAVNFANNCADLIQVLGVNAFEAEYGETQRGVYVSVFYQVKMNIHQYSSLSTSLMPTGKGDGEMKGSKSSDELSKQTQSKSRGITKSQS